MSGSGEQVFTEADYTSGDGFQTAIWGPSLWFTMHVISFNYPVRPTNADKKRYAEWLVTTGKILPCKYCRDNFAKNLRTAGFFKRSPSPFANREAFSRLVWRVHDKVNKMLGKPPSPPYEEVRAQYEKFRSRCLAPAEVERLLQRQHEAGCTEPVFSGAKARCRIQILPRDDATVPSQALVVDERCQYRRIDGEGK